MLKRSRRAMHPNESDDTIDMSRLWNLAFWGGGAALMLAIAVFAGRSETGTERVRVAVRSEAAPTQPAFDAQAEIRRLSQQLRILAADRERLQMRLASLERNLDNVTGSVAREIRAARAAVAANRPPSAPPQVAPVVSAPPKEAPAKAQDDAAAQPAPAAPKAKAELPADVPLPRPEPLMAARSTGGPLGTFALTPMHVAPKEPAKAGAKATRTEFGIDIGSAATLEALRTQWQTIRRAHPKLLEGMRPLVSIHDVAKRRTVEVHLLIGPIADAKAAARHCAALVSAGLSSCKTTEFEGQRLVIR